MLVPVALLRYIGFDDLIDLSFFLTLSPSSGITCTGSRSSGSGLVVLSCSINSSVPGTRYCLFIVQNIFMVYGRSVTFYSTHLMYLLIMDLLVSGLYSFYVSLVFFTSYHTIFSLNVLNFLSFISPLIFSLFVTYAIRPNS